MLTIQPNFSQTRYMTSFGQAQSYDYSDDIEDMDYSLPDTKEDEFHSPKDKELASFRDDINETIDTLKDIQNDLPPAAKKIVGGLFTLGAAAVAGISTKFGVSETSKALGKVSQKQSVKNLSGNIKGSIKKLGNAINNCFDKVKKTGLYKSIAEKVTKIANKFKKTSFAKKIGELADKITNSKIATNIKGFFKSAKKIDSNKIVDRTGDVLGTATGVSTAAVGIIDPEQKAKVEG